jgi:hypothetical protein
MVFDENSLFITYFNPFTSVYEVWVVEAFRSSIEVSFLNMLKDYYINKKPSTPINYHNSDIVILQ